MACTSVSDAPLMLRLRGVPGMSHWEEERRRDPGLCHLAGLRMPWNSPGSVGGNVQREESLGVPAQTVTPATRQVEEDGKMDKLTDL